MEESFARELKLGDFLSILGWNELRSLAKILGVDSPREREEAEDAVSEISMIRWKIWLSSGLRVKVSRKARYIDGWKFCPRCGLSFKYISNVSNEVANKCPLCHGVLRRRAHSRKKNKKAAENAQHS